MLIVNPHREYTKHDRTNCNNQGSYYSLIYKKDDQYLAVFHNKQRIGLLKDYLTDIFISVNSYLHHIYTFGIIGQIKRVIRNTL